MSERHLRILVADDQAHMRRAVRALLRSKAEWEVCGEASDGREAIEQTHQLRPDVVVMDIMMPRLNGLDATREIRRSFPETHVVVLTLYNFPELFRAVREAGGKGCVLKEDSFEQLIPAIESVGNSSGFFRPSQTH